MATEIKQLLIDLGCCVYILLRVEVERGVTGRSSVIVIGRVGLLVIKTFDG